MGEISEEILEEWKNYALNYAKKYLEDRDLDKKFKIVYIIVCGGMARCYFSNDESIKDRKDIDLDIFFYPKAKLEKRGTMKVNTQRVKQIKNPDLKIFKKPVDFSRTVLLYYTGDAKKDINCYAEKHGGGKWYKKEAKEKAKKERKHLGRINKPALLIYPERKNFEKLKI